MNNKKTNPLYTYISWWLPMQANWEQDWMIITDNKMDKHIPALRRAETLILL